MRYHLHDFNTSSKAGLVFDIELHSDSLTDHDAVIHRGAAMQLLLGDTQPLGFAYNLAASVASQVTLLSFQ